MDQPLRRGIDTRIANSSIPAMLNIAGTRFRSLSILRHVGRRSGREYATPITAFPLGDGFVIALLYGDVATVDWCRNVIAAGACTIKILGQRSRWNDQKSYRQQLLWSPIRPLAVYAQGQKDRPVLWVHRANAASQQGEA